MEISYENRKLRKLCENETESRRQLGSPCSKRLRMRLNTLADAATMNELLPGRGRPHPLGGDLEGQFALALNGERLIFRPNHDPVPEMEAGGIDRSKVTKVTITDIRNYHRG